MKMDDDPIPEERKKAIIYGAGEGGRRAYTYYRSHHDIIYFADGDANKWGSRIADIEVIGPEKLVESDCDLIIIASQRALEIYRVLRDLGVDAEKIEVAEGHVLSGEHEFPWIWLGIFGLPMVALAALIVWWLY